MVKNNNNNENNNNENESSSNKSKGKINTLEKKLKNIKKVVNNSGSKIASIKDKKNTMKKNIELQREKVGVSRYITGAFYSNPNINQAKQAYKKHKRTAKKNASKILSSLQEEDEELVDLVERIKDKIKAEKAERNKFVNPSFTSKPKERTNAEERVARAERLLQNAKVLIKSIKNREKNAEKIVTSK